MIHIYFLFSASCSDSIRKNIRKCSKSMLIYPYIVHVIQYVTNRYAIRYNFYKKLCDAFFYAGTIQLFHVHFSLSSGSDTTLHRSDSRKRILFLLTNICFIFGLPSANGIYLFLFSSLFSLFFSSSAQHVFQTR